MFFCCINFDKASHSQKPRIELTRSNQGITLKTYFNTLALRQGWSLTPK